jgi:hypothetical protein
MQKQPRTAILTVDERKPMSNAEMPAAVIGTYAASPEYLVWPLPSRTRGQALLQVMVVPINPLDLLCASGAAGNTPDSLTTSGIL